GGASVLLRDHRVAELDAVLALFEQATVDQDIADVADLERFFSRPVRQPDSSAGGIEIMTIHRAKGLEFDCVILPGLARTPPSEQRRLLEWCDLIDADGQRRKIVAPLRRIETEFADWIRRREREHALAETARLMYVATTRAKARLHLVWGLTEGRKPPAASLLAPLWGLLEATPITPAVAGPPSTERIVLPLRRMHCALPISRSAQDDDTRAPASLADAPAEEFAWSAGSAAHIGIVVHDWLQTICDTGAQSWDSARVTSIGPAVRRHLHLLGVLPRELQEATQQVLRALQAVLEDERGRWIIGARSEARSEIMLSSIGANRVIHQRLDRTFVADGYRWIIDYKTSECGDGDVDAFLAAEVERYRDQLEGYAAAMAEFDDRPIRLGLYFPMLPAFRDWPAPAQR
ncbi:MAG TPA: 3'-5' exonuclease, partial [Gammaproteobacteria bacterium]|nr:3'-5' exonuclease [Gammaproteobacteria bacterium]